MQNYQKDQYRFRRSWIYGTADDDDIVDCRIRTPVTIDDHGTNYETTFFAGSMMSVYDEASNTLRPSTDWGIIINKEITLDDMKEVLEKKLVESRYKKVKEETKERARGLLLFAHHAAKMYKFPQDSLYELTDAVYRFTSWRKGSKLSGDDMYVGFLEYLNNPQREGRNFSKYVVASRMGEVVESYSA